MLIRVMSPSGKATKMTVDGSDTIGDLKTRIQAEGHFGGSKMNSVHGTQCLTFAGNYLDDERTIQDHNIGEGAMIYTLLSCENDVDNEATIKDAAVGWKDTATFIYIRTGPRTTIRMPVKHNETLDDLKVRIRDEKGVPNIQQCLLFAAKELFGKTLQDNNVGNGATVCLFLLPLRKDAAAGWEDAAMFIYVKTMSLRTFRMPVRCDETVYGLKVRIHAEWGDPPSRHYLVFKHRRMEDIRTLQDYGIEAEAEVGALPHLAGGGGSLNTPSGLGLIDIAQATALCDWDGIMPCNKGEGLKLSKDEVIMIGRIVNSQWYQGFKDGAACGYVPRSFVRVQRILISHFKDEFGEDAPTQEDTDNQPALPSIPIRNNSDWSRLLNCFRKASHPQSYLLGDRPVLPPSPVKTPRIFDETLDGNRLIARFQLESKDAEGNYIIRPVLALNSAPDARFSSLTLDVKLIDGIILAIFPDTLVAGPETEAEVSTDKSLQTSVNTSLGAGSMPATSSIGAGAILSRTELTKFTRRTRGTIQGVGVGTTEAYWVIKEDPGDAARHGLDPDFDLAVKLNVRPAVLSFKIKASIQRGSGKERIIRSGSKTLNFSQPPLVDFPCGSTSGLW